MKKTTYHGKESDVVIKQARAKIGPMVVVLEQPVSGPSPVNDFLESNGQGIHHICLEVDELEQATREMNALGYRELGAFYGLGLNKDGEAAYFDTEENLGIVINLAKMPTGGLSA